MTRKVALIVGGALIVLGVIMFPLQNLGEPEAECAEQGAPSSGFVAEDDPDCAITIESYEEIRDWESGPKLFRIAGIVLILAGLGVGGYGLVRGRPSSDGHPESSGPPAA